MSRLRARLANNEADRDLQGHLAKVKMGLLEALSIVDQMSKLRSPEARTSALRAARYKLALKEALGRVESIGMMVPAYDQSDVDLIPEALKKYEPEPPVAFNNQSAVVHQTEVEDS